MKKTLIILIALWLGIYANAQTWDIGTPNATDVMATLNNDTLYIKGTGNMMDFSSVTMPPWYNSNSSSDIKYVEIEENITNIGSYAFRNCTGLISITIPSSVASIGSNAFFNCTSLTSVTIPSSVTSIESQTFDKCRGLTSVIIPSSVTSIGFSAFINCTSLTSVIIPNSVTSIESQAFGLCSSLTSVIIPNSVTSIGNLAFSECSGLTSVIISNSVTSIEYATFNYCSSLTSVIIPNSVTSIGTEAFSYCGDLTSVVIPNSVTSIRNAAFAFCDNLTSVIIPASVTSIGNYAFAYCGGLTAVTNLNPVPQSIVSNVFQSVDISAATLIVPCDAKAEYEAASGWRDFGTIEEMECPKPGVSNVKADFSCPGQVTVTYDLKTDNPTDVTLYYSPDGGKIWLIAQAVTGNLVGETSGIGKTILWDNLADKVRWGNFKLKVEVPQTPKLDCVEINGVCWATRNVGAPGTFVDNPEDAGMFYQWNRNIGWSATDPLINSAGGTTWDSTWDSHTPIRTTWETTNNVCPMGYRMPTPEELQSLVDAGSQWTIINGVNGRVFGNGDNKIFLPAVNTRLYNNGKLNTDARPHGYYWSSTRNQYGDAYVLFFDKDYVSNIHTFGNPFLSGNGLPCRCVAE